MMDTQPSALLGVDIGGTSVKAAVVDTAGSIVFVSREPTFGSGRSALETLHFVIRDLISRTRELGFRVSGIGICSPGVVLGESGVVVFSGNLGWDNLGLVENIERVFQLPVTLENDAGAGAIAEVAARDRANFEGPCLFVPLGTGLAAALTVRGALVPGASGSGGRTRSCRGPAGRRIVLVRTKRLRRGLRWRKGHPRTLQKVLRLCRGRSLCPRSDRRGPVSGRRME